MDRYDKANKRLLVSILRRIHRLGIYVTRAVLRLLGGALMGYDIEKVSGRPWRTGMFPSIVWGNGVSVVANHKEENMTSADRYHIVHCVNVHDKLVDALESAYSVCKMVGFDASEFMSCKSEALKLEKILAKARALSQPAESPVNGEVR